MYDSSGIWLGRCVLCSTVNPYPLPGRVFWVRVVVVVVAAAGDSIAVSGQSPSPSPILPPERPTDRLTAQKQRPQPDIGRSLVIDMALDNLRTPVES